MTLLNGEYEEFAATLRRSSRLRHTQAQLWESFRRCCPAAAARSDQRQALVEALQALAGTGVIRLPAPERWDRSLAPALPLSVSVVLEAEPDTAIGEAWLPRMAFAASVRNPARRQALAAINRYLRTGGSLTPVVPLRERSLHIFGDEKRLEAFLVNGRLFDGQMDLIELGAHQPGLPLANEIAAAERGAPILVLENHHSYESFRAWNSQARLFAAVVYGSGNLLPSTLGALHDLVQACGARGVLYLGDLDLEGLLILERAQLGAPGLLRPHYNLYRWLLGHGSRAPSAPLPLSSPEPLLTGWPSDLAQGLRALLAAGQRIAQENLGTRELSRFRRDWSFGSAVT